MILITKNIADNLIIMRGLVFKVICLFLALFFINKPSFASEKIGIITDTMLTSINYYNAYYRTPEFFATDIQIQLAKRNVEVVPLDVTQNALKKTGITQNDLQALQSLQQGYNLEYSTLRKIAKSIGVSKLIIVTMGMDVQRDFLKNTIWNMTNVPGMDVVNPTHRVSVYVGFADIEAQSVIWESIYAKNIRNNKMKNLDTAISNNYEGMLRLKEYSKYISPDIAYNVTMKLIDEDFVEPPTYITKENLYKYAKDKHNIGSKKELSEIHRKKWDDEKLIQDSKENIIEFTSNTKEGIVNVSNKTKNGIIKATNKTKSKFTQWIEDRFDRY